MVSAPIRTSLSADHLPRNSAVLGRAMPCGEAPAASRRCGNRLGNALECDHGGSVRSVSDFQTAPSVPRGTPQSIGQVHRAGADSLHSQSAIEEGRGGTYQAARNRAGRSPNRDRGTVLVRLEMARSVAGVRLSGSGSRCLSRSALRGCDVSGRCFDSLRADGQRLRAGSVRGRLGDRSPRR